MATVTEALRPHFETLARVGYYKNVFTLSPRKRTRQNVFRAFMWFVVLMYNLQHIIRAFQSLQHTDQLVDTLFILLTTLNTLGKQIAFNTRERRIDKIIHVMNGEDTPDSPYTKKVIQDNVKLMSRILRLYHVAAMVCGVLWTLFPIMNKYLGENYELTGYIPYDTTTSPIFELTAICMGILITIQAFGNVTMDCVIAALYAQAQTQFKILRYNLEHLTDKNKNNAGASLEHRERFKSILHQRFIKCVKQYEQIVGFVKEVESIFSEAMIVQFVVMAWVICMTLYKIVGLSFLSLEYISMVMYLMCMMAQLFIYCYYGTQLKCESELIINASYNTGWESTTPQFRRGLLILMERCKRPVEPRTAYIVPHSLNTYISVLRSSYALFTFLTKK